MLREISLFGAGVPSLLLYFLAAVLLFLAVDQLARPLGLYRLGLASATGPAGPLRLPLFRSRPTDEAMRKLR